MVAQSYIGDQGYAVGATAVCVLLLTKIMNFKEICSNLGAPSSSCPPASSAWLRPWASPA